MKLKLLFISLFVVLLIPIQGKAETYILPWDPKIDNIEISKPFYHVFKTDDILEIKLNMINYTYNENDVVALEFFNCIINSVNPSDSFNYCDIPNDAYSYDDDTDSYILRLQLDEGKNNKSTSQIVGIKIYNNDTELSIEYNIVKIGEYLGYLFYVNNDCATNNHTIKSDTQFEIITQPTCTELGSKGKRCIYCKQMIDETIEEISVTGHTPSENYTTIKHATCIEKGSQAKKCTTCGKILEDTTQETPIDSSYHVGGWTKAETDEYYYAKCNSCGADIYHNYTSIDGILMDGKRLNIGAENGAFDFKGSTANGVTSGSGPETAQPTQDNTNTQTPQNNTQIEVESTQDTHISIPLTPNLKSVKNNKKKTIAIIWKKVDDIKGYEVQYALNKKFTKSKKSKALTKTSLTVKKLKKGKIYYVRVRGYNISSNGDKVYSNWSKVKMVKIKK